MFHQIILGKDGKWDLYTLCGLQLFGNPKKREWQFTWFPQFVTCQKCLSKRNDMYTKMFESWWLSKRQEIEDDEQRALVADWIYKFAEHLDKSRPTQR